MRELLIAYLFGQLDEVRRDQLERALAASPDLREELAELRAYLGGDDAGAEEVLEPPADLVQRTCERVAGMGRSASRPGESGPASVQQGDESSYPGQRAPAVFDDSLSVPSGYSRGDLAVVVGLTLVAAMLLFPALYESRVAARRDQCQLHLSEIGRAVIAYAQVHGGAIPHVPASGREAFAGVFPVQLGDGHFIEREVLGQLLICPATIRVGEWKRDGFLFRLRIPTREELLQAPEELLKSWRRYLAGSYAYRFGYVDRTGRYTVWRVDHSPRSAILADAPSLHLDDFQSANHGGRGLNVLFADGHVDFLCGGPVLPCGDHLFKNRVGYRAASCDAQDTAMGRSEDAPRVDLVRLLVPRD